MASQPESKPVAETLAGAGELLLLSVTFPHGFPASFTLLNSDLVSLLYDFFFFPPLSYSQNFPVELFVSLDQVSVIVINYCESSLSLQG